MLLDSSTRCPDPFCTDVAINLARFQLGATSLSDITVARRVCPNSPFGSRLGRGMARRHLARKTSRGTNKCSQIPVIFRHLPGFVGICGDLSGFVGPPPIVSRNRLSGFVRICRDLSGFVAMGACQSLPFSVAPFCNHTEVYRSASRQMNSYLSWNESQVMNHAFRFYCTPCVH